MCQCVSVVYMAKKSQVQIQFTFLHLVRLFNAWITSLLFCTTKQKRKKKLNFSLYACIKMSKNLTKI